MTLARKLTASPLLSAHGLVIFIFILYFDAFSVDSIHPFDHNNRIKRRMFFQLLNVTSLPHFLFVSSVKTSRKQLWIWSQICVLWPRIGIPSWPWSINSESQTEETAWGVLTFQSGGRGETLCWCRRGQQQVNKHSSCLFTRQSAGFMSTTFMMQNLEPKHYLLVTLTILKMFASLFNCLLWLLLDHIWLLMRDVF